MSEWMTYRQVAERLNLTSTAAAAQRARRGKWPKRIQTLGGPAEVLVPATAVRAPQREASDLEPLGAALAALPVSVSRAAGSRWLDLHPNLGMRIGGRCYVWREAREAISRGVPLDQAAEVGRLAKERYFSGRS